ncbi:MAG TPA: histidine kinase [Patescibacteria group bacterium]|nr:histidine kinase [Patescibacteria group bacterium]
MRFVTELRAAAARHPVGVEVGSAIGAFLLVMAVSIAQWGATVDGFIRGLSLGASVAVVAYLIPRRRRLAVEQRDRAAFEQRVRIARELHDTVAGAVSAIGIQAAAARRVLATQPDEAAAALERIERASRAANLDLRRMLDALRDGDPVPAATDAGLDRLAALADEIRASGPRVSLTIDPAALRLSDPALDQAAYRIVQEALTNVVRHAGAVRVNVDARVVRDRLELAIVNGPGRADSQRDPDDRSLGIVGMRERVALFGGTLDTGPTADGGYAVRAILPMTAPVAAAGRPAGSR